MTAICRLNVDDILSEWTNERAYFSRCLLSKLVPAPEKKHPTFPRAVLFFNKLVWSQSDASYSQTL